MTEIPGPPLRPVIANLDALDADRPIQRAMEMAEDYGEIYRIETPGQHRALFVSSHRLVDELCDEERFDKRVHLALKEIRAFAGDGLFTARTHEDNWEKAHRILMPAFAPVALGSMFDGMLDIADQLLLKWERTGEGEAIDVTDDFTRLTLDTIALCAFSYRFNSFYRDSMHPFVDAMVEALREAGERTARLPIQNRLMLLHQRRYDENVQVMHEVADRVVQHRRANPLPDGQTDILTTMLEATDPVTGERLSDENIRYQLVTFLIAGHETTSGLLSFCVYELLRHPEVLADARREVDEVLGGRTPRADDLPGLGLLDRILRETLRLWPTAPAFAVYPLDDTTIGDGIELTRRDTLLVLTMGLHRDPEVWEDPERFDPSRFHFDRAADRPVHAWKPFGNGQRSCIGRGFALQEAQLVLAMMLQRFELEADDPDYELRIEETLTLKQKGLRLRVRRRTDGPIPSHEPVDAEERRPATAPTPAAFAHDTPVRVWYGSNAGTSQSFANRLAQRGTTLGYATEVAPLDDAVDRLGRDGVTLIVTSSYEGRPPDNARAFVDWVQGLGSDALDGVRYAVFGCGNTDWSRTYQRIPILIDEALAAAGATRVAPRGAANARGDFLGDFEAWDDELWPVLAERFDLATVEADPSGDELVVRILGPGGEAARRADGLPHGTVVVNRELADLDRPEARSRRHLEIALPEGETYRCGDYLAVLPLNPWEQVDRALARFDLAWDVRLELSGPKPATQLPLGEPIAAGEVFASWVELGRPAGRRQVETLAELAADDVERSGLRTLADPASYEVEVLEPRLSVLDLLERFPSVELPLGAYLGMLTPLARRQYSISSSPRWSTDHATLTVAHLDEPARSGTGRHRGVASTFLAEARPGTRIPIEVRPSNAGFQPPADLSVPLVMVAAGTGIAPFRGFVQDRALRAEAEGVTPAPALLFFGCRGPGIDFLYRDEWAAWEHQGVVSVRPAFSRAPETGPDGPMRYVQDRLWADRADVAELVRAGATFYVCGDGERMAPAVHDTCVRMYAEATGADRATAEAFLAEMEFDQARYVSDIFG